jgi:hypothetical protein
VAVTGVTLLLHGAIFALVVTDVTIFSEITALSKDDESFACVLLQQASEAGGAPDLPVLTRDHRRRIPALMTKGNGSHMPPALCVL